MSIEHGAESRVKSKEIALVGVGNDFAVKAQIILCAGKYSMPGITPPYKPLRTVPERITALSFPELSIPVILKIGGCKNVSL